MCMQNFWFVGLSSAVPEILAESQNLQSRSCDLGHALFKNFSFFDLVSLTFNPRAKFELCILSRSSDIRGISKFKSRSGDLGHAPF